MYCAKCGHKNPDDSIFCSACGQRAVVMSGQAEQKNPAAVSRTAVPKVQYATSQSRPNNTGRQPAPRKQKNGTGLIVTIIVLIVMIIALIGLLIYFLLDGDGASDRDREENSSYSTKEQLNSPQSAAVDEEFEVTDDQTDTDANVTEATESTQLPTESEPATEPTEEETEPIYTQPTYENSSYYSWLDEDGFFLADSDRRYLTQSDVYWMNTEQIQYAINEIYARHGRIFQTDFLQSHFESLPWYYGTTTAEEFSDTVFNVYEKANVDFLSRLKNES